MQTPGAENEPIQPEEDELQHLNTQKPNQSSQPGMQTPEKLIPEEIDEYISGEKARKKTITSDFKKNLKEDVQAEDRKNRHPYEEEKEEQVDK